MAAPTTKIAGLMMLLLVLGTTLVSARDVEGSGRSLLLQGGNVPDSEPGVIYKCSDYDNYSKDIASLVAKCPKGPKPVNLCLVGKARGGCSTKITDQFPGADCREQCTAYY